MKFNKLFGSVGFVISQDFTKFKVAALSGGSLVGSFGFVIAGGVWVEGGEIISSVGGGECVGFGVEVAKKRSG